MGENPHFKELLQCLNEADVDFSPSSGRRPCRNREREANLVTRRRDNFSRPANTDS